MVRSFSAEEVAAHNTAESCWLIIHDKVYDVTAFLPLHPAGASLLLGLGGKDATRKFDMFHKPEAVLRLVGEPYCIGSLLGAPLTPAPEEPLQPAKELRDLHSRTLRSPPSSTSRPKPTVAVVGGGIAGAGCAWALDHSGQFEVSLFEREKSVGGNATTYTWPKKNGAQSLTSCISVLAWPKKYFRNYEALLNKFGIKSSQHRIRFMVAASASLFRHHKVKADGINKGGSGAPRQAQTLGHLTGQAPSVAAAEGDEDLLVYAHDHDSELRRFFKSDLEKWSRMRLFVDRVNAVFHGKGSPEAASFYTFSLFNPLNVLSLRRLSRIFGVSDLFWRVVFISLHSSSFLTTHLDTVPAQLLPVLEDMVSMDSGGTMSSWLTTSQEVFDHLVANFEDRVHTSRQVRKIRFDIFPDKVGVVDFHGETEIFDKVVIATDAGTALSLIQGPTWLQRQLLSRVSFTEDFDKTFLYGQAHTDSSIFPADKRQLISSTYANFIRVLNPSGKESLPEHLRYENTFCLGWSPCLQSSPDVKYVSYNNSKPVAEDKMGKTVYHVRDHPEFHPRNLFIALILHLVQGSHNKRLYFCGSSTTPGNGHDLSLLSGFVIANAIGAPYPFQSDPAATSDFQLLQKMMMTSGLFTGFLSKMGGGVIGIWLLIKALRKYVLVKN